MHSREMYNSKRETVTRVCACVLKQRPDIPGVVGRFYRLFYVNRDTMPARLFVIRALRRGKQKQGEKRENRKFVLFSRGPARAVI